MKEDVNTHVTSLGEPPPEHGANSSTSVDSMAPSTRLSQEGEEEGFQPISRKRNKGKSTAFQCSLPKVINTRQAYKTDLPNLLLLEMSPMFSLIKIS